MDFLTTEYVKQEAAKGELPALKCSRDHHHQGTTAPKLELINAIKDKTFRIRVEDCACCVRFPTVCGKCPLKTKKGCCDGLFDQLQGVMDDFERDYSNANLKAFRKAEAKLCKYIEGKIAEEEAKECKCKALDKPELRHGDYGKYATGEFWLVLIRKKELELFGDLCGGGCPADTLKAKDRELKRGNIFDDLRKRCEK